MFVDCLLQKLERFGSQHMIVRKLLDGSENPVFGACADTISHFGNTFRVVNILFGELDTSQEFSKPLHQFNFPRFFNKKFRRFLPVFVQVAACFPPIKPVFEILAESSLTKRFELSTGQLIDAIVFLVNDEAESEV